MSLLIAALGVALAAAPAAQPWIVGAGRVGGIRLGRAIPRVLLERQSNLPSLYFARFIADFRPYEGFTFADPPVAVAIARGPFARETDTNGTVPERALNGEAASLARAGARVQTIVIESSTLRTARGVGVGSTLSELEAAYRGLRLNAVPPTFGRDLCAAHTAALPRVAFYFTDCAAARGGAPVVRIMMFRQ